MNVLDEVRNAIYSAIVESGRAPETGATERPSRPGRTLGRRRLPRARRRACHRAATRLARHLWAPPFSAVPTPFRVATGNGIVVRPVRVGCVRHSGRAEAGCATSTHDARWSDEPIACGVRARPRVRRRRDSPAGAGRALLGRHRLHLSEHPALPVGRRRRALVPREAGGSRCAHDDSAGMGVVAPMVRHQAESRFPPAHGRRSARDLCERRTDRRLLGALIASASVRLPRFGSVRL